MTRRSRTVISCALALGALLAFGIRGAASDAGQTKPGPGTLIEGAPVTDPPLGETAEPAPFTIPAESALPRESCPDDWRAFDNTAMHYTLCYPPAWGFTELRAPDPLEQLRSVTLGSLRLLNMFPWKTGDRVFDAVLARGGIVIELNVVPKDAPLDPVNPACALASRVIEGTTFDACEESIDATTGQRAPLGPLHVLRVAVPLLRTPERITAKAPQASRLMIVVRSQAARFQEEASLIWQIVRTALAY
jgi:hypothetical protein